MTKELRHDVATIEVRIAHTVLASQWSVLIKAGHSPNSFVDFLALLYKTEPNQQDFALTFSRDVANINRTAPARRSTQLKTRKSVVARTARSLSMNTHLRPSPQKLHARTSKTLFLLFRRRIL
jgi:hypothetical protein